MGCSGEIAAPNNTRDDWTPPRGDRPGEVPGEEPIASPLDQAPRTAIARLSRRELDAALGQVFGVHGAALRVLPPDVAESLDEDTGAEIETFDTNANVKTASDVFIRALEGLAEEIAVAASENHEAVHALAGCTPSEGFSDDDLRCLEAYTERVGRRMFRRPLREEEVTALVDEAAAFARDYDFYVGVRLIVQTLVQSPDFLYRVELGTPDESEVAEGYALHRLTNYELMTRLSLLILGEPPSDALLDRAAGEELSDEALATLADELLAHPRATEQIRHFHASWIRYDELRVANEELRHDMVQETEALIDRATDAEWSSLFASDESYVTAELAAHYGMDGVSETGWASYQNEQRAGVLSHGAFLSASSIEGTGTTPSRRGALIAKRFLCWTILPPPPDVNADDGVALSEDACKTDAYAVHAAGSCASCHDRMDPVGFGFERFDGLGGYREVERVNPSCTISGEGNIEGQVFYGPREFVSLTLESGALQRCGVQHFLRYASRGHTSGYEAALLTRLGAAFVGSGEDFRALIKAFVTDPVFRTRKEAL